MKPTDYLIIAAIVFIILIPLIIFSLPGSTTDLVVFGTSSGNVSVPVEVMRTREELQNGLMYRESLDPDSGMLFIFSSPKTLNFWMKNTLIPLDMIFISDSRNIVKIEHDVPPCEIDPCPNYGGVHAKYVVEVNVGFAENRGIKEGDKVYLMV